LNVSGAGLGAMPAWLCSNARPAGTRTPAECAQLVKEAADELDGSECSDAVRHLVNGLRAWLHQGGDLNAHLGVRAQRGKAAQLPHRNAPKQSRDAALRQLADTLPMPTPEERARELALMVLAKDPQIRTAVCLIVRHLGRPCRT
jgi:hypothetical protein